MAKRTSLELKKYSGTGNTFLLFLADSGNSRQLKKIMAGRSLSAFARDLCDPYEGVGADGFLILHKIDGSSYRWDFFNSDGSKAEMCGNAARCVGLFLSKGKKRKTPFRLLTGAGYVHILVDSANSISVTMPAVSHVESSMPLRDFNERQVCGSFINTGVPHFVMELPSLDIKSLGQNSELKNLARHVQAQKEFQPNGTNVTFYSVNKKGVIHSATFERGVYDFTKACGTGAVAAAVAYVTDHAKESDRFSPNVMIHVPGGQLKVEVPMGQDVELEPDHPVLTGPAKYVADILISSF